MRTMTTMIVGKFLAASVPDVNDFFFRDLQTRGEYEKKKVIFVRRRACVAQFEFRGASHLLRHARVRNSLTPREKREY